MIRALVPRVFGDMEDWAGAELARVGAHPIRVEDFREKDKYVLRAELPGVDPDRDVKVIVDHGVLTVEAQRSEEKHERHCSGANSRKAHWPFIHSVSGS